MSDTTLVLPGDPTSPPTVSVSGGTITEASGVQALPDGAAALADTEPDLEPDTPQPRAFDAAEYRIDIPEVDGVDAESIVIAFAGAVELNIADSEDLALFNSLRLGKEVELRVAGTVADKGSPLRVDKDGVKTMVRKAKIAVHTVYVLSPEELS